MPEIKKPDYVWMDGEFIPFDEAKLHVFTVAVKYGINVFEGLRAYWNEDRRELYSFRIRDHYQRLFESIRIMSFNTEYSPTECERLLVETLRKNNFKEDVQTRHTIYLGGYGSYNKNGPTGMHIVPRPLGRVYDLEKGISCSISSWVRINDNSVPPRAKAGANYINSRLATVQAQKDGYNQPIILDLKGKVSECASSCFFMIRKGVVVTPPVTGSILESVTRDTIMELCRNELNLPVEEREIDRTEVYVAKEAFLCATGAEIAPITSVDKIPLGNGKVGPITQKIMKLYFDIVRGINPKYYEWLTPTYGN